MIRSFRLFSKFRKIYSWHLYWRFNIRKILLGFEIANQFLLKVDKTSLKMILRRNGAKIGENCDLESNLTFHNCSDYSNLIIGRNCHIGKNCFFDLRNKIIIGNNVVISMNTSLITHLDVGTSVLREIYKPSSGRIKINDNCYVGAGAIILMNTELGEGSFVAAGSVVTRDVPPFTLVAGVPAKVIKQLCI